MCHVKDGRFRIPVNGHDYLGRPHPCQVLNRPRDAVSSLEKAVHNAPQSAAIYFDLASAYQMGHDKKRSIHAYEKVLELAPNSPLAKQAEFQLYQMKKNRN